MAHGPLLQATKRFAASVTVPLPPDRAFAYLEQPPLMRQWIVRFEDIAFDQPGIPRGAGTRFRLRIRTAGRSREYAGEITAYRPPQEVAVRLSRPEYSLDVDYRLTADAEGTRIEQSVCLTIDGWAGVLAGRFAAWLVRGQMRQGLAQLKAVVEAGRTGGP